MRRMREIRWNFSRITNSSKRLAYLRFLSNPRIRLVSWDPVTVYEHMKNADIGIIPVDTSPDIDSELNQPSFWQVKSENRLSMKMCVGLPVIATPIPSYEPLIDQGRNGFLANSLEEWMGCLNTLRNPDLRREIGEQARASVVSRFSMDEQARLLIEVLREVLEI
jgi:glycosyltransferase involved in cell wall biosynthesis